MRDVGAVTQGELLRQEQEAGVVPVSQVYMGRQTRSATARGMTEDESGQAQGSEEEEPEHPHARGPEEVGVEDTGPQERTGAKSEFDVDAALGRTIAHKGTDKRDATEFGADHETGMRDADTEQSQAEVDSSAKSFAMSVAKDDDDDEATEMVDADGQTEPNRT